MAAPKGLLSFCYHVINDYDHYKEFKKQHKTGDKTLYKHFGLSAADQDAVEDYLDGNAKPVSKRLRRELKGGVDQLW